MTQRFPDLDKKGSVLLEGIIKAKTPTQIIKFIVSTDHLQWKIPNLSHIQITVIVNLHNEPPPITYHFGLTEWVVT